MSKRLQVVLHDDEYRRIRQLARARRQTVSEWVRNALRDAEAQYPTVDAGRKVQVVREAALNEYPAGEVGDMLREIEQGYRVDDGT